MTKHPPMGGKNSEIAVNKRKQIQIVPHIVFTVANMEVAVRLRTVNEKGNKNAQRAWNLWEAERK